MLTSKIIHSNLPAKTKRVFIAYSGGVDSHVLLHLASLDQELKPRVTAVYVNHGLQAEANAWAEHCKKVSVDLGVQFKCLTVNAQKAAGQSQEEAARNARYKALKALLQECDVLLLAQHREDQMETVLLQLFRGAGVKGLSGMPTISDFGHGKMGRPFLDTSQQAINEYAKHCHLSWVEDTSNQCDDFDRNFLRNQILPQLKNRWPALDKTVSRSARHCASSQSLVQGLAHTLFEKIYDFSDETLIISKLLKLSLTEQQLLIREWFNHQQLRMPSEKMLQRVIDEVLNAKVSASPKIQGQGYCICRYRDKLFCLKEEDSNNIQTDHIWLTGVREIALAGGCLSIIDARQGISKLMWDKSEIEIKYRQGAEKIKLPGREGHHVLKKLFQEQAIPPWQRKAMPLIYLDNHLAAVGDLWISTDFFSDNNEECYQIVWK